MKRAPCDGTSIVYSSPQCPIHSPPQYRRQSRDKVEFKAESNICRTTLWNRARRDGRTVREAQWMRSAFMFANHPKPQLRGEGKHFNNDKCRMTGSRTVSLSFHLRRISHNTHVGDLQPHPSCSSTSKRRERVLTL